MPVSAKAVDAALLADLLRRLAAQHSQTVQVVVVERQGPRPGQGVGAVFKAGRGVGVIEGVIATLGWPLTWVSPAAWKATMQVPKPTGPKKQWATERKELSRRRACELMPGMAHYWALKKHHGRAEAALMCLAAA